MTKTSGIQLNFNFKPLKTKDLPEDISLDELLYVLNRKKAFEDKHIPRSKFSESLPKEE